ncbi:substrate binding domain of ABC-type glycine betaine transport system family protein [Burkholderia mallei NCTC 10247]|uniref:ABC transporter, quaternary amine uptake transporter (QAT) family, periplasmic substrate-binding protein n=2 Tax=Burkholderia mallei TaxID=13373 RepID=A2RYN1_BURM9|nr:glycine betaine ABC transporter substrate-binding protein [Burkholderia mallei]ABM98484.1 ABC transporter, quaternary amine uptake transporter (QAT) family, periplasmic substrate-binding protein [Burkholderia mallei NCTC 10229]AIO53499.1 substrate binding domain of ABC-type glycine betaine transport system family protein [Burkholderia mallei]AIO60933.1 substrate binding domain of ABC-type glycine betaine transport system family protein [Burkholderia mallei]AIS26835.1 substrate binding domain
MTPGVTHFQMEQAMKRYESIARRLARRAAAASPAFAALAWCAAAAAATTTAAAAEPAACRDVRMAGPGWTDIEATNALAGVVLKALGYRQSVSNLSVPITYQGLKKGQLDVFLGNWMPAQAPLVKPFVDARAIDVLHANLSHAKFTLAVPDYVAAAGVHSFADLAKYAQRFGAKIYGIEPGAPANQNISRMLADKALGPANWQLVESSETGMLTQVERADFASQCANLARLFRQMTFTVDLENGMIAAMLQGKRSAVDAAQHALRANPSLVEAWLDGVRTASGAPGLPAVRAALDAQ